MTMWKREKVREKSAGEQRDVGIQQADALFEPTNTAPFALNWLPSLYDINEAATAE